MVNKVFEISREMWPFSDFQYVFGCSQSVSDRIARAFNRPGATQAVALDISKAFNKV